MWTLSPTLLLAAGAGLLHVSPAMRPAVSDVPADLDHFPCKGQPDPDQQLNGEVLKVLCQHIQKRGANFLVFGLGRDSAFWLKNTDNKVKFLENHPEWLHFQDEDVLALTHVVNYTTELADYEQVLDDPAKLAEFFDTLPADVVDTRWDVILVDSPMGMEDADGHAQPGIPGRMQSVSAALKLAHKGTVIFVDDYQRHAEEASAAKLLVPFAGEPVVYDNGHWGKTAMFVMSMEDSHPVPEAVMQQQKVDLEIAPCVGQPDPDQQLNGEVLRVICQHIKKSGANFLVFGLGRDSAFWLNNTNNQVKFLENHAEWLHFQDEAVLAVTHVVNYTTELADYEQVLDDPAKLAEFFEVLPSDVVDTRWDVILVDSPMGMEDGAGNAQPGIPGRMQSVSAAFKLAHKGTVIFVDDYQRHAEKASAAKLLTPFADGPKVFDNGHGGQTAMFVVNTEV